MALSSFVTAPCSNFGPSLESLLRRGDGIQPWDRSLSSISLHGRAPQNITGRSRFLTRKNEHFKLSCSQKKDASVVEAGSMEEIYDALADRLLHISAVIADPNEKYLVGLAGPPGAGKSTLASEVVLRVNKFWPLYTEVKPPDVATVLPMDGFHLYRAELDAMEDPDEAHAKRGAPWTFNAPLLLNCLKKLRHEGSVYAPSFDHGVGDPVEDDIFVSLQQKVVIIEGNYLLLQEGSWKDISDIFDEKWFIDVDLEKAMQRVEKRHVLTGKSPDIARWRIVYNDRPNAELIMKSKENADLIIRSVDICT